MYALCVLLCGICLLETPKPAAAADAYDDLRIKWKTLLTGEPYSGTDADMLDQIGRVAQTAQDYWDDMEKSSSRTYLWSDLDDAAATSNNTISSNITTSYRRLEAMALAYATNGSGLYQDAALLADIVSGLDWMNANKYNSAQSKIGNWFDWEIGAPLTLNNSTVLLYEQLSAAQIANYMDAVDFFSPSPTNANGGTATGANRVWKATVVGVRGIVVKDSARIAASRDALTAVFGYVTSGDGFYADGSFLQHARHPYTGAYGEVLITNLSNFLYLLKGSAWEVVNAGLSNVFKWVYDSYEPLMYQGLMMDMSRGRAISRRGEQDHVAGSRIAKAVLQLSRIAPAADAANFKSMVKYWIQTDTFYPFYQNANSLYHIALAKSIVGDSTILPRGEPVGYYPFASMDRAVSRRPDYGFAVSMSSKRIYNYESINNENWKGWYASDGMTYLYNGDLGQFSDEFWGLVNPYRLPGTTVDTRSRANGSGSVYLSPNNWVGGAEVAGSYGVAGMELDAYGSSLTAEKSWFMFADKVVALGAGITSTDNRTIETIVENRKINAAGSNALTVDGTARSTALGWSQTMSGVNRIHLQGSVPGSDIGYYFPDGATVKGLREARTGSWLSVNTYAKTKDPTVLTRNFLTLWLDHGADPSNDAYSYVLLPGRTSAQVDAYADDPDVVILANSPNAQAVKDESIHAVGINFWNDAATTVNDGGVPFVTSGKKASVALLEGTGGFELGISDPTQANTGTIDIEIHRPAGSIVSKDAAVTVVQLQPTVKLSVNVSGAKGRTFHAALADAGTGVSPIVNDHFDATATGTAPSGWTIDASGGTAAVAEDPSASNKSLLLADTSAVSPVVARRAFAATGDTVTAEFKVKYSAGGSHHAVQLMSGTTAAVRRRTTNGKIQVNNGGVYTDLQSYVPGQWYTVKIVADPAADAADIYIDDVARQSGGAFAAAVSSLDTIQFATHSATASMSMNVDEVMIKTDG